MILASTLLVLSSTPLVLLPQLYHFPVILASHFAKEGALHYLSSPLQARRAQESVEVGKNGGEIYDRACSGHWGLPHVE